MTANPILRVVLTSWRAGYRVRADQGLAGGFRMFDNDRALALLRPGTGRRDAAFRDGQEQAIRHFVDGMGRLLVVQRTGWGKSFVSFIAARLLRERGQVTALDDMERRISPPMTTRRPRVFVARRPTHCFGLAHRANGRSCGRRRARCVEDAGTGMAQAADGGRRGAENQVEASCRDVRRLVRMAKETTATSPRAQTAPHHRWRGYRPTLSEGIFSAGNGRHEGALRSERTWRAVQRHRGRCALARPRQRARTGPRVVR